MFLGIDCGTQGTKALVIDENGDILGHGHAAHALTERKNGAREQDPAWWVTAMATAIQQAVRGAGIDGNEIRALGISGQQHSLVVLDEAGKPVRPAKLWNDTETAPQDAELISRYGRATVWTEKLGIIPLTGYTISKILWIRHIPLPHDYLNYWLTGRCIAEAGDASGTGFFDIRHRAWAPEPLAIIDDGSGLLERALPELVDADALVGQLTPAAAEALGLSPAWSRSAAAT